MSSGAYSPSTNTNYNSYVSNVDNTLCPEDANFRMSYIKKGDITQSSYGLSYDSLQFVFGDSVNAGYYNDKSLFGSGDPNNCAGGIKVTIKNGHFIGMVNSVGMGVGSWSWATNTLHSGSTNMNPAGTDDDAYGTQWETNEWFLSDVPNEETLVFGVVGAQNHCFVLIDHDSINCNTKIEVELLYSHNGIRKSTLYWGDNISFTDWGLPKHSPSGESEDNGDGYHSFYIYHPKTNQIIVGDKTFDISNFNSDIVFYGGVCPLSNKGSDILVYKYNGNSNTQGELQCVIFYDKLLDGTLIPGGESLNTIEYFQFSNYTTSMINAKLSTDLYGYAVADNNAYVYIAGGNDNTSNYSSSIQKMSKSRLSDISIISTTLITSRAYFSSGSSSTAGYFFGGAANPSTTTRLDSIENFTFSTTTESDTTKTLTSAKQNTTATNDWPKNTQSFIIGGQTSTDNVTEIDKYVYATDTAVDATNSGWTLLNKLGHATSTGNQDYIWIFGGVDSSEYNTIQRLTIATGSGACNDRADLIIARHGMASSTNQSHTSSFIIGGRDTSNYFKGIEEYNHSNDTVNTSVVSALQEDRVYIKGVQV